MFDKGPSQKKHYKHYIEMNIKHILQLINNFHQSKSEYKDLSSHNVAAKVNIRIYIDVTMSQPK